MSNSETRECGSADECLAERFAQGLGWLARARQSYDRAEKYLYFFTAIESVLTNADATSPVLQTARSAACILQPKLEFRHAAASDLMKLYQKRSALIHMGRRNITQVDVNTVQHVAEGIFLRILEFSSLYQKFSDFQGDLNKASFGASWPHSGGTGCQPSLHGMAGRFA